MTFVHPGALNSKAELDFVKTQIQAGAQPWKGEFDQMRHSGYATRGPHGLAHINSRSNDAGVSQEDATASYAQSLLWYFTDDEAHAQTTTRLPTDLAYGRWATTITTIVPGSVCRTRRN
jgi:hypothetical protein